MWHTKPTSIAWPTLLSIQPSFYSQRILANKKTYILKSVQNCYVAMSQHTSPCGTNGEGKGEGTQVELVPVRTRVQAVPEKTAPILSHPLRPSRYSLVLCMLVSSAYLYARMHIHIHIHIHILIHILYVRVYTNMDIYIYMYIRMYVHVYTHAHTSTRTHARTHTRTYKRTHAHTHACTHARMHARTHAHTHARTHARMHARTHARTH